MWSNYLEGSQRGSTWPRGYIPCWQLYTNKTRVMPFIPTKSVACMSTTWLLGNVYTAKSCKGKKRDPDALTLGLAKGDNPDRKHRSSRINGRWAWGCRHHPGKDSCREIWRSNSRILQLAEASEEGQGPRRAVEPMMIKMVMMMMIYFEAETRLDNTSELSPYLKKNTILRHYKDQLVNAV
jgi:hypothetical protein